MASVVSASQPDGVLEFFEFSISVLNYRGEICFSHGQAATKLPDFHEDITQQTYRVPGPHENAKTKLSSSAQPNLSSATQLSSGPSQTQLSSATQLSSNSTQLKTQPIKPPCSASRDTSLSKNSSLQTKDYTTLLLICTALNRLQPWSSQRPS